MWFVDQADIVVKAGDGGRGCSSFAHPPYTRYPYPDGGNGGDGGDVIVMADPNIATLLDFQFRHEFSAGRGGHGGSNTKTGKRGELLTIHVPVGTVIHETLTGAVLRDLSSPQEHVVIACGGGGGFGNAAAPEAQEGSPGEEKRLTLELKLLADVGLIGFPNAGKSSLLSRLSTAHPKIAPYPFTTTYPVLGVVEAAGGARFVACDIPGLIEGASQGKGLGFQFLRHIERTRLLVHLIDMAAIDGRDPADAYAHVNQELAVYSPSLQEKPQLIAANKMDLPQAEAHLAAFRAAAPQAAVWPISCATGAGIPALLRAIAQALAKLPT
ncbi:MAG: GTPase ObgE [Candidatus Omnitrophica bacterium]|nr:GTPase ObgE [Candidatus Omnitrophota bacterium]